MITKWILIILLLGSGKYATTVEFNTRAACETARQQVLKQDDWSTRAICVENPPALEILEVEIGPLTKTTEEGKK